MLLSECLLCIGRDSDISNTYIKLSNKYYDGDWLKNWLGVGAKNLQNNFKLSKCD